MPSTLEEWKEHLRNRPEEDAISFSQIRGGGNQFLAGMMIVKEREEAKAKAIRDEEYKRQVELAKLNNFEPTLLNLWRVSDWQGRIGMITLYVGVFLLGFGAAKIDFLNRLISLFKELQ